MLENYRQQSAECRRGQLWNAVNQALEESDNNVRFCLLGVASPISLRPDVNRIGKIGVLLVL